MSKLELSLFRYVLRRGFEEDTTRYEAPGHTYTLARTFILHGRKGALWVFHNLLNSWLVSEEELHRYHPTWSRVGSLLFVLDGERLARPVPGSSDPPVELFSRMLRDIEKFCLLRPNRFLPMRVAVVVACPSHEMMSELFLKADRPADEPFKSVVMSLDPALHALLLRTVAPKRLRFWGWVAPFNVDQTSPLAAQEVGRWILGESNK
jgi:hypothetical protein